MVENKFNLIDFNGIDLATSQGSVIEGLYQTLVDSISNERYPVIYNWKFSEIDIAPSYVELTLDFDGVKINDLIIVSQEDVLTIPSLTVEPILQSLAVTENGVYTPETGVDGFNEVSVNIPPSVPDYEKITPEFFGLSALFISSTSVIQDSAKNQAIFLAELTADSSYVMFLPKIKGNRFRANMWAGKSFSDFSPYIDTTGGGTIFTGGTLVCEYDSNLDGTVFFDGVNGTIIVQTSNNQNLVEPILLKIKEEI